MFLLGILRKRRVWMWFFGGENVVECVVNVVFWQSLSRGEKMRQIFEIYFRVLPVLGVRFILGGLGVEIVREGSRSIETRFRWGLILRWRSG